MKLIIIIKFAVPKNEGAAEIRNDGPYYRPVQQPAQSQYRPQIAAPGLPGSGGINSGSPADEGILSTLSNGFNSLVNNIFG
ncbi:hypothetical protein RP20_CCG012383 [Aedes albopictus]|nr:hypothetical protein RP20_CCG012383 [Aedes albopictus]